MGNKTTFTLNDVSSIWHSFGDTLNNVLGKWEHRLVVVHVNQIDDQLKKG